jgi:hypothetical protein
MKVYLLVAVLVFGLTVAGKLLLDGRSPSTGNLPTIELALQSPCDLRQGACTAADANGRSIRFSINPASIPLMEELSVQAETTGLPKVSSIRLTVEGVNMFMGYQYADLQAASTGQFSGKLILPVCTLEKMQWLATLEALTPDANVQAKIPFETFSSTLVKPFNQQLLEK